MGYETMLEQIKAVCARNSLSIGTSPIETRGPSITIIFMCNRYDKKNLEIAMVTKDIILSHYRSNSN